MNRESWRWGRFLGEASATGLVINMFVAVCALHAPALRGENCKPDISRVDKITKRAQEVWTQKVGGTGFGDSLMGSTDMAVFVTIGRYGNANAVNVEILKEEASAANASFDSALRAVKGNQFFLGFAEGGEPLTFVATDVGNETKVRSDVLDFGKGKVVTTVVLSTSVSDETLAALRPVLITKRIDAIRVLLAGDLRVEYSLKEKTGKKLTAKFQCFFDAMDQRGLSHPPAGQATSIQPTTVSDPSRMAAVQGRYARNGSATDFIELNADGTSGLLQDGHSIHGNYTVQGDTITFTSPEMPGQTSKGRIKGDTIKDDEGIVWEKMTEAQRAAALPLPKEPELSADSSASALGRYLLKGTSWYMELKPDGSIACQMHATKPCYGTYVLAKGGVRLKLNIGTTNMRVVGKTLLGKTQVWEKQADMPATEAPRVIGPATTTPVTLRVGMTPEEVEKAQGGKPLKVIDLGSKKIYVYSDMKVIFVEGKVSDIQ